MILVMQYSHVTYGPKTQIFETQINHVSILKISIMIIIHDSYCYVHILYFKNVN